jgi:hypothetical protein
MPDVCDPCNCEPEEPSEDCESTNGFLVCDSVVASKSKCGFGEFIPPSSGSAQKRYLIKTGIYDRNWFNHAGATPGPTCSSENTIVDHFEESWTYVSNTCTWSRPCIGSGMQSKTYNFDDPPGCHMPADVHISDDYCNMALWPGGLGDIFAAEAMPRSCSFTQTQTEKFQTCTFSIGTGSVTFYQVLSDEYTTDMLKDNIIAALPEFDGTFSGGGCLSYYSLNVQELTGGIQRSRYKWIGLMVTAPCMLRWHEVERDQFDALVVSVARSLVVVPGMTESPVYNLEEPETKNHTITIVRP